MAHSDYSQHVNAPQDALGELSAVFSGLDDAALLGRLQEYRPTGRQGYPLKALWRAYVGSFVLNLPHTTALIRRLEDDPRFRILCGLGALPHRRTFEQPVPGAQAPAAARILGVFHRAAPLALRRRVVPLDGSEAYRDADDLAVLLLKQEGGDGGINASVHGHDGSSFAHGMSVA